MLSTTLLIIFAVMCLCVGFIIGGIYATVLSCLSAIMATIALIISINNWRSKNK